MDFKTYLSFLFFIMILIGCNTQKKVFYNPNVSCELKTPDGKLVLKSQVKFSSDKKSEKNNVVNKMYDKILFNGIRQNQCVLNRLVNDPNPKTNFEDFFISFWEDESREDQFHKIISRKKNNTETSTYIVEFNINKLKKHLNENNIK